LAAPFVGSLLGVLIRRLPAGRPVAWARSACESCGHPLGPTELVPLLSYLAQRGRCRHCGARIAPFHFAIELAAVAVALSAVGCGESGAYLWAGCGLGWTLLALAWIDAAHLALPDVLTLPLLLAGLLATGLLAPEALGEHALGAGLGWLALWAVAAGYRLARRREGLGQGDAKLLAAGGAWLGWQALPWVLLLAALLGLAWGIGQRLRGYRLTGTTVLAFGPWLAAATWLFWLLGGGGYG
jgi:leader peptidase (prepilin peptidase)/N-methyltransferase